MLRDSECTLGQMPHAMAELAQNSAAAECKRMGAPVYCSWSWYWTIDLETSNPHHGRPASTFWPGNPLRSPSGFSEFWAIYHCCPPYMIWFSFKQLSGSNAQKYLTSTYLQKAGWEEKENADLCIRFLKTCCLLLSRPATHEALTPWDIATWINKSRLHSRDAFACCSS